MKKLYIQPQTEITVTALDVCVLQSSPYGTNVRGTASSSKDVLSKDRGNDDDFDDLW